MTNNRYHSLSPSRVGIGTARGAEDEETDEQMVEVLTGAILRGISVFDTAGNYRRGRSERAVGEAIRRARLLDTTDHTRTIVMTKGGYLRPSGGIIPTSLSPNPHGTMEHCLSPDCLWYQIELSLATLGLDHIDVYLLHNPEVQQDGRTDAEFDKLLAEAFSVLESAADKGLISVYGVSTWRDVGVSGASRKGRSRLDIARCKAVADAVAPRADRFAVVQAPLSLLAQGALMPYYRLDDQYLSLPDLCEQLGVAFVASAAAGGGAIQEIAAASVRWVTSIPGIATALVSTQRLDHLDNILHEQVGAIDRFGVTQA